MANDHEEWIMINGMSSPIFRSSSSGSTDDSETFDELAFATESDSTFDLSYDPADGTDSGDSVPTEQIAFYYDAIIWG